MGSHTVPKVVPVIDFSREDLKPGTSLWLSTCKEVCNALGEYGCFVALYNKVSPELENAIFSASKELLDLPVEIKRKNISDKPYFGYLEPSARKPLLEQLSIENASLMEEVQKFTNILWPAGNVHFCKTAYSYTKAVAQLDQMVVRMIFEHYGLEKYYDSHIGCTSYLFRFSKNQPPQAHESQIAFPRHTDKTFITIVHQNDVNGLEIKAKNGEWIGFELTPSSFVVIAGEVSMGWSNDRIRSCDHRVIMNTNETRYTVGLFSLISGRINVPEELVDDEHPLKYKPFDNLGLINYFASAEGRKAEYAVKAYCGL